MTEEELRSNPELAAMYDKKANVFAGCNHQKYLKKDFSNRFGVGPEKMLVYDTRELEKHGVGASDHKSNKVSKNNGFSSFGGALNKH